MKNKFADFVPHPRFGRCPIESGEDVPIERYASHWRYFRERYFPDTAIWGDPKKQHFSIIPLPAYADVRKTCRTCGRPFLFFALEQKHWYEELGFPIDADCVHCPECRKQNQRTRAIRRRQEGLLARQAELDDAGWLELAEAYAELYRRGMMKTPEKVNWALNRVRDHGSYQATIDRIRASTKQEPPS